MCKIKKINNELTPYETECGRLCTDVPVHNGKCVCCKDAAEVSSDIDKVAFYQEQINYFQEKYFELADKVRTHIKEIESQGKISLEIKTEQIINIKNLLSDLKNPQVLEDQHGKKYYMERCGYYVVGNQRLRLYGLTV